MLEGEEYINLKEIAECCLKRQHEHVINKQKEAIADLRNYVGEMEELTVNMSLPQLATHKILKLRMSNEELKKQLASEILQARINHLDKSESELYQEVCYLKELVNAAKQQIEVEENYRRECQNALEASEDVFLKCIKAINSELGIKTVMGCGPINYIEDTASKEKIINERGKGVEVIVNNIKSLKHQMQRKDGLLQSYEESARRLCKSRGDTEKQTKQINELKIELEAYKDEVNYLQESLRKTQQADMVSMEFLVEAVDVSKVSSPHAPPRRLARERIKREKITPKMKGAMRPFKF